MNILYLTKKKMNEYIIEMLTLTLRDDVKNIKIFFIKNIHARYLFNRYFSMKKVQ